MVLNQIEGLMAVSRSAMDGVEELRQIIDEVRDYGVPDSAWKIDLSIARGLDYYTGPVFETQLLDFPSIGSVFSGGRYDKLVGKFCGEDIPAVGASVGVDRLLDAIVKLGLQTAAPDSGRSSCACLRSFGFGHVGVPSHCRQSPACGSPSRALFRQRVFAQAPAWRRKRSQGPVRGHHR